MFSNEAEEKTENFSILDLKNRLEEENPLLKETYADFLKSYVRFNSQYNKFLDGFTNRGKEVR